MAHVPHDLVAGRVEAVAERDGQLDHAQPAPMCPPVWGHDVDQPAPHLVGKGLELVSGKPLDVRGTGDRLKERHFLAFSSAW